MNLYNFLVSKLSAIAYTLRNNQGCYKPAKNYYKSVVNKLCSHCLFLDCCNKFGTSCLQVVLASLIRSWYNNNVTRLTKQDCNNIVISWPYQTYWNNLVTSLIIFTRLLQVVNSLMQILLTTCNNQCQHNLLTAFCRLATSCIKIFSCAKKMIVIMIFPIFTGNLDETDTRRSLLCPFLTFTMEQWTPISANGYRTPYAELLRSKRLK